MKREEVFRAIRAERKRQDQLHPEFPELSPMEVAAVLSEECGEAVKELNALQWNEPGHTNEMLVTELVHTAAVAVRILEVLRFARMPEPERVEEPAELEQPVKEEPETDKVPEQREGTEEEKKPKEGKKKAEPDKLPYKGFVHLRCDVCGATSTFCTRTPMKTYKCDSCGAVSTLGEKVVAVVDCKCGQKSKYQTNIQDYSIEVDCVKCGQPNDLVYNAKRNRFEPMDYSCRKKGKQK